MKTRTPSGFTLIELLVVITILGMLMAIAFPAFQTVLETTRRTTCQSQLKGIAQAMLTVHNVRQVFPGLVEAGPASSANPRGTKITWATRLLPELGQKDMWDSWNITKSGSEVGRIGKINAFYCPSDPPDPTEEQPISYVANAGSVEDAKYPYNDKRVNVHNGVFFNRYWNGPAKDGVPAARTVSLALLSADGAGNIIMLAENISAKSWGDNRSPNGSYTPYDRDQNNAVEAQMFTGFVREGMPMNKSEGNQKAYEVRIAPNYKWARPSSNHDGGAHVAFCDGTARFVSQGIEPHIFVRHMTHNVKKSTLSTSNDPVAKEAAGVAANSSAF